MARTGTADLVMHMGDIAYADNHADEHSQKCDGCSGPNNYQDRLNAFYESVTPIGTRIPMMYGVGNHDMLCRAVDYKRRVGDSMPFEASGGTRDGTVCAASSPPPAPSRAPLHDVRTACA